LVVLPASRNPDRMLHIRPAASCHAASEHADSIDGRPHADFALKLARLSKLWTGAWRPTGRQKATREP